MKTIHYILICYFLVACKSDTVKNDEIPTDSIEVITEIQDEIPRDSIIQEVTEQETRGFGIFEMPSDWLLLSEHEGVLVIIDSWDSQGEKISFIEEGEGFWDLEVMHSQETETGAISDFQATISTGEISLVTGSFTFYGNLNTEPRKITFEWNQIARICEFKGIGLGSEEFTPAKGSDLMFETIVYEREED